ncbi:magnesium transporter [Mycolicibacterium diernhoferi]|uniref:Magnesium transporter MgtE n=1 Tax=Mycolicibacterium diernhoferi TaxID=1801 RepID=A0A1Q4HL85_9MYCO|nr:magnesium transporter [Mycolicibacterium diernhoferi]OJZ68245.1 magnesium transporter [Mycolicibacterium diernhoferi]OPE53301.1 magnesium transporter [Mycolicibacterium diernhoferi]PEG56196.1 magnesium transporter [Mycolicibacterium diernhoferi]QYL21258.1 magnesium transporter [Mycolicibacterium diernhoferi]
MGSTAAPSIRQAIAGDTVTDWLASVKDPAERSHQLARLATEDLRALGPLLDHDGASDLFEAVDDELAARVLAAMAAGDAAALVEVLDLDHAADILREIKAGPRERLLSALPQDRAEALRGLLSWPEDSVAAHMVPEALTVRPDMTIGDAVQALRSDAATLRSDSRSGAYVYVTDADRRLLGVLAFRDLVLADPQEAVAALTDTDVLSVSPLTDAEDAAQALMDYNLVAVPVVDADNRLLGILTENTAGEITEEEATEDAERQGGSEPLEVPYLRASPWLLWRKRVGWLLLLFVAEAYTGTVLRHFEEEMEAVVALAFFIPLLIGTGGNTGTQITTTLVRAMATGQVRLRDVPAVLAKEMSTGMMIALTMALAALIRAWMLGVGPEITLTVTLTVAAIVLWSSFVASILPPVLKKCRIDPAVVSAPLIATVVDGTGLIIYFMIAHATLSQLQGL